MTFEYDSMSWYFRVTTSTVDERTVSSTIQGETLLLAIWNGSRIEHVAYPLQWNFFVGSIGN